MPAQSPPLLPADDEVDESRQLQEPDPVNNLLDPAHPIWLEEQEDGTNLIGPLYFVATMLFEERDFSYLETPPVWAEDASEEVRDWGVWAWHGVRTFVGYED